MSRFPVAKLVPCLAHLCTLARKKGTYVYLKIWYRWKAGVDSNPAMLL